VWWKASGQTLLSFERIGFLHFDLQIRLCVWLNMQACHSAPKKAFVSKGLAVTQIVDYRFGSQTFISIGRNLFIDNRQTIQNGQNHQFVAKVF